MIVRLAPNTLKEKHIIRQITNILQCNPNSLHEGTKGHLHRDAEDANDGYKDGHLHVVEAHLQFQIDKHAGVLPGLGQIG